MNWPQIAVIIFIALELGFHLAKNGEPRNDNYDFWWQFLSWAVLVAFLIAGGFWS